ncbi:ribosome maturation factor [Candidatus Photodesmus blepharus]|uniref:Ribosome maturation factor RimP n=1 Tax=Candidatus Photodesmus blepharonis TaxID=1179155 RepID=A0A084CP71_9GAMM|nr:ribosome maturation factor RimP [Candidatus Photodesmus blepharus]KEY91600.1 ribosome maturation factor [Candidatus Photodesmus blepharus]
MTSLEQKITGILNIPILGLGYELIGVEFLNKIERPILRIYIDKKNGINLDDCAKVSHHVTAILDVEEPISVSYNLEVSSPGLARPLFKAEDYEKFRGRGVNIILNVTTNCRKLNGIIHSVNQKAKTITIIIEGKKKEFVLGNILKANLIPNF